MQKITFTIFAMICVMVVNACAVSPTLTVDQDSDTREELSLTDSVLRPQEESRSPTESPSKTPKITLKPAQTEEVITSTVDDDDLSVTSTVEPSPTNTLKPSATATFNSTELFQGSFYGIDENHQGAGNAIIVQTGINDYSLHLDNFEVTSGPGLHVILAEDPNPYNIATLGDYLDLGELLRTSGDQTYTLPSGVNLENYGSVVIYCVPFEAIFAIAPFR
jgi:hypothetical protein